MNTKGLDPKKDPAPSHFSRGLLLNISLSLASLLFLVVLAELATLLYLKISGRPLPPLSLMVPDEKSSLYQFDEELGWVLRPLHSEEGVKINSLGFRSSGEFDFKEPGREKILLLGDSMVFGKDLPQPMIFSELLNEEMPQYRFINTAVNGYSTWQEYLTLKRFVDPVSPSLVILFFTQANDLDWNTRRDNYHPGISLQEGRLVPQPVEPRNRISFYKRLQFYRLLDHAFLHGRDLHYLFHRFDFFLRGRNSADWTVTRKILHEFSRLKSERGFSLLVIDLPTHRGLRGAWMSRIHRSLLREICREEGLTFYDLADHYPRDYDRLFLSDRHHWNADGHRFIADFVKAILPGTARVSYAE